MKTLILLLISISAMGQMPIQQVDTYRNHAAEIDQRKADSILRVTKVKVGQVYLIREMYDGKKWWRKIKIKEVSPPNLYYTNIAKLTFDPSHEEYEEPWWNLTQLKWFEADVKHGTTFLTK